MKKNGFIGILLLVIVSIIVLAIIGSALNLITIPWLGFNSKIQMNRDVVIKTYNADNAIYNYHWFQERAGAIKALDQQIIIASDSASLFNTNAGSRDNWTFEDKTESSRLNSITQGLKSQRASFINEYNAKASEADRSMFVDDLPLFFNL